MHTRTLGQGLRVSATGIGAMGMSQSYGPNPGERDDMTGVLRYAVDLEVGTGAAALVGGALLAAAPDGRLLRADPGTLAVTPFTACNHALSGFEALSRPAGRLTGQRFGACRQ